MAAWLRGTVQGWCRLGYLDSKEHPMDLPIDHHRTVIEELCRRYHVRRLDLFGSAATDAFDAAVSDLDFLVEFDATPTMSRADQYFGLIEALEDLFQRKIDLVTVQSLRNPYFIRAVSETRLTVYAA
jgi:predicted nucleotidyltransferase